MQATFLVKLFLEIFTEPSNRYVSPTIANDKKELRQIRKTYIICALIFTVLATIMAIATINDGSEPFFTCAGIFVSGIFLLAAFIKIKRLIVFNQNVKKARTYQ